MTVREVRGRRGARVVLLTVLLSMLALLALPVVAADPPAAGDAADGAWLPLTVLYMTDVKGKIEPCG